MEANGLEHYKKKYTRRPVRNLLKEKPNEICRNFKKSIILVK